MKKVVGFILAWVLSLSLVACGSGDSTRETSTESSGANELEVDSSKTSDSTDTTDSSEEEHEPVTIKFATFSAAPDHIEDLEGMISAFEEEYPYITVEYETVSYDDYFTKLQSSIAAKTEADTFELNYESFVTYASKGVLLNLDDVIAKDTSFDSSIYNEEAYDAFKYDDSQYGLVESFSNCVFIYNKDLFDAAGLDYPDETWTWEDELEAAQILTDKDAGVWGTYSPIQFTEFYKTVEQNGGHILNDDKTESVINSPQNVETLQWMIDKINKYEVTPSDAQMSGQSDGDLFVAGKIAMIRTGIWMFTSFADADFDWDISLEPGNTQKAHHFFANGICVSVNTEHPEEAWLWSRFMTSAEEATSIRVASNWELPAVTDEDVLQAYLDTTPPDSKEVVFEALDTLVVPPVIENWNELTELVGVQLDLAKIGEKTPQEALDTAKEEIDELLNQ